MFRFVILLIYEWLLWIGVLFSLPKMLYHLVRTGKYRKSFLAKWGFSKVPALDHSLPIIWVHGVSMGEVKAVEGLVKQIHEKSPETQFVISTGTETGQAEAHKIYPFAKGFIYLPFDSYFIMRQWVKAIAPNLAILSETDWWVNWLFHIKSSGAKVVLVNGKISEKSLKAYQWIPFWMRYVASFVSYACIQNDLYYERFKAVGFSLSQMAVTGNLKLDIGNEKLSEQEKESWREKLGIKKSDFVIVAGSTHDPEEKMILKVMEEVWRKYPSTKLLIVPRHPERFDKVAGLLKGIKSCRYSKGKANGEEQVVLIDAMGVLKKCYQLATVALVAGSWTPKVGGHNILEPCPYGIPVLYGPHVFTQKELHTLADHYKAAKCVSEEELAPQLIDWLEDEESRLAIGANAKGLIEEQRGACNRTYDKISSFLR